MKRQTVNYRDLGNMAYKEAWDFQEELLKGNLEIKKQARDREIAGEDYDPATEHHLLFVEHPPVYTLGKSGDIANVLLTEEQLAEKHVEFFYSNRGGDITFHGPGQLVGYPILDLEKYYTDIGRYLRNVEEVMILTMAEYGLKGDRSPGETGVWMDPDIKGRERKIGAIGVRSSRWITMHGFAFNVNTDLRYFDYIIPCGIRDKQVTSMERELGRKVDMSEISEKMKRNFETVFTAELLDQNSLGR
ncbi:MAG: lipoyl(octanoyl) transferase LipB [Chitinophagaceae bacterium]|nr:MAG: lipoyl(octanoyl) transferase LipB [Chitinophagaceae bacterium]